MEKIFARGNYTLQIEGKNENRGYFTFTVNLRDRLNAEVTVNYESKTIETLIKNINVPDGFTKSIKGLKSNEYRKIPTKYKEEISAISRDLSGATKKVISLIKYYLRHFSINEHLIAVKKVNWGDTEECLFAFPSNISFVIGPIASTQPLREDSVKDIQSVLDKNIEPLVAMRHIHRARAERQSHHMWIDATIAAELAIKEVLARANPILEHLLMEVPSPPLDKLYGSILETYMGEKSPYIRIIQEGVKIRNQLIHKPNAKKVDSQAANDYVAGVEASIFHLLSLLYSKEPLIISAYSHCKILLPDSIKRKIKGAQN